MNRQFYYSRTEMEEMEWNISAHQRMWESNKDPIIRFADDTEASIRKESDNFFADIDRKMANMPQERANEYGESFADEWKIMRDEHPRMLRYAHCFMAYSAFERSVLFLHRYCCYELHCLKENDSYKDPKIGEVRDCFKKMGFRKEPFGEAWQFMNAVRNVRNAITHNDGLIPSDKPQADWNERQADKYQRQIQNKLGFAKYEPHLTFEMLGQNERIIIESPFITKMLEQADKAMDELYDEAKIVLAKKIGKNSHSKRS